MAKGKNSPSKAAAKTGDGKFFKPVPLAPPKVPTDPKLYSDYIIAYRLYEAEMETRKQVFWERAHAAASGAPYQVSLVPAEPSTVNTFRVAVPNGPTLIPEIPTYAQAVAQAKSQAYFGTPPEVMANVPQKVLTRFQVMREPKVKPVAVAAPPSEGAADRKRAARRRQRAARSARDASATAAAAKRATEVNEAKLALLRSAQALDKFTLVVAKRSSRLPVPAKASATNKPAPVVDTKASASTGGKRGA